MVRQCIEKIIETKPYPEQAYKSCLGILSMGRKVGKNRLVAACKQSLELEVYNYNFIKRILENKSQFLEEEAVTQISIPFHENIRGPESYK